MPTGAGASQDREQETEEGLVVVVSLSIECLVAVFKLLHHDPARLPQAAAIGAAAALLLVAWGLFVRWNATAERLEPEAMKRAKREDREVDSQEGEQR